MGNLASSQEGQQAKNKWLLTNSESPEIKILLLLKIPTVFSVIPARSKNDCFFLGPLDASGISASFCI